MSASKYARMLKDPKLRRWNANLARGSPITAVVALRRLGRLCELMRVSPRQMVAKADVITRIKKEFMCYKITDLRDELFEKLDSR